MTSVDHDGDGIPEVIPRVEFNADGEPMIAREMVVRPSPVPRALTIILILLAAISIGYTFLEQDKRNDAAAEQQLADDAQDARLGGLVTELQTQQAQATKERERLRNLVLGLIAADTESERRLLLEEFARAEQEDPAIPDSVTPPAVSVEPSSMRGRGSGTSSGERTSEVSSDPVTDPSPEPQPSEPAPEQSEPATLDVPELPVPLPAPVGDCLNTSVGRVCT